MPDWLSISVAVIAVALFLAAACWFTFDMFRGERAGQKRTSAQRERGARRGRTGREIPPAVRISFYLWSVWLLISAIVVCALLIVLLVPAVSNSSSVFTVRSNVLPLVLTFALLAATVGAGFCLLALSSLRNGDNWARTTLTVFGGIGLCLDLWTVVGGVILVTVAGRIGSGVFEIAIAVCHGALFVTAVSLLYLRRNAGFFKAAAPVSTTRSAPQ